MKALRIIRGSLYTLMGVIGIGAGVDLEVKEPWFYLIAAGLIGLGAWSIYKELRDSAKASDISEMSKQRDEIAQGLEKKD